MKRLVLLGVLALTACGPMNEGGLGQQAADAARAQLGKLTGTAPATAPAPTLPPGIENIPPGNILLVTLVSRNLVAPLTRLARNNGSETWVSPGKITMTFRDDVLVATRGLSEDLMGADVYGVRAALTAGGGTSRRVHSYLDSTDQIQSRNLSCVITANGAETIATIKGEVQAQKYSEACTSDALIFTNVYWLDRPGGNILQSRQVVAPDIGFIQVNPI